MPDVVMRNKNKDVQPYVLSIPIGVEVDAYVAGWIELAGDSWALDKKTDPLDVPPLMPDPTALPADQAATSPKGK